MRRQTDRRGITNIMRWATAALVVYSVIFAAIGEVGAQTTNERPVVERLSRVVAFEDQPLVLTLEGFDPDGDPLTALIISSPRGYLRQVNPDGTCGDLIPPVPVDGEEQVTDPDRRVCYEALLHESGSSYTAFSYVLVDDQGLESQIASIIVDVVALPDDPVASPTVHTANSNLPLWGIVLQYVDPDLHNPVGIATVHITDLPERGTLYIGSASSGNAITPGNTAFKTNFLQYVWDYWPACVGSLDSFSWYVEDETGRTSPVVTDTIRITQANCPPTPGATPANVTTTPGTQVGIPREARDPDGDSAELVMQILTLPQHGDLLRIDPFDGSTRALVQGERLFAKDCPVCNPIAYLPDSGFTSDSLGPDGFTYTLTDEAGGTSGPFTVMLWVSNNPAVPELTALSQTQAPVGSSGVTISVTGSGFAPTSVVQWNGTALETTFVSPSELAVVIPQENLTLPSTAEITVSTPAPGGGVSNPGFFYVAGVPISEVERDRGGVIMMATSNGARVTVHALGDEAASGTVGLAALGGGPAGGGEFASGGAFFDLRLGSDSSADRLFLLVCDAGPGALQWHNGSGWAPLSEQIHDPETGCTTARFAADTTPNLAQLRETTRVAVPASTTPLEQTITFNPLPGKTYGDAPFTVSATATSGLPVTFSAGPNNVCTSSGVNGGTIAIASAGQCTVTASQAGDETYNPAQDVQQSFDVSPASLTITADDQSMIYGETMPAFTTSYSGFVNGDTPSVVSGLACSANDENGNPVSSSTPMGTYTIACSGASADNYTISYEPGTLTITPASLEVTASGSQIFGSSLPAFSFDASLPDGVTVSDAGLTCTKLSSGILISSELATGSYTIDATSCSGLSLSGTNASNYQIHYAGGAFTVEIASTSILYDGEQTVQVGQQFTASADLFSVAAACEDGQMVTFTLDSDPITGALGSYFLGSASTTDGSASMTVNTAGWNEGVFSITVTFAGTNSCLGSTDEATLTIASPGNAAHGGGWYTLSGSGRVQFGLVVRKDSNSDSYSGHLRLINNDKWRLKGTLTSYVQTNGQGSVSGTGDLYWWNPDLNGGLGDWELAKSGVSFTGSFTATSGKGKKGSDPGSFGIHIDYHPVDSQPSSLPNSSPTPLKAGNIKLS